MEAIDKWMDDEHRMMSDSDTCEMDLIGSTGLLGATAASLYRCDCRRWHYIEISLGSCSFSTGVKYNN